MTAKQEDLERLHEQLCVELGRALRGESEVPAAVLNTTRQFLSDNDIHTFVRPGNPDEFINEAEDDFAPPED